MDKPDYKLLIRYLRKDQNGKADNKQTDNHIRRSKEG